MQMFYANHKMELRRNNVTIKLVTEHREELIQTSFEPSILTIAFLVGFKVRQNKGPEKATYLQVT